MEYTKCIELVSPDDRRRKATIVTNNKELCKILKENPETKLIVGYVDKNNCINVSYPFS